MHSFENILIRKVRLKRDVVFKILSYFRTSCLSCCLRADRPDGIGQGLDLGARPHGHEGGPLVSQRPRRDLSHLSHPALFGHRNQTAEERPAFVQLRYDSHRCRLPLQHHLPRSASRSQRKGCPRKVGLLNCIRRSSQ